MKKYEPLAELMLELTGWVPAAQTLARWRKELGLKTVRLRGRICANREDLITFLETSLDRVNAPNSDKPRSAKAEAKAAEAADKELTELGI
jgi:hypothetical protein